jgi:hypothetical protein
MEAVTVVDELRSYAPTAKRYIMRKGKFRTRLSRAGKFYYVIRDRLGRFSNLESLSRSARRDRAVKAKKKVRSGLGFRGDRT